MKRLDGAMQNFMPLYYKGTLPRRDQSISSARRLVKFNNVLLKPGSSGHPPSPKISANQKEDDSHIKDNDNLKTDKKSCLEDSSYTGAKKDWHPYFINTIEMRSL